MRRLLFVLAVLMTPPLAQADEPKRDLHGDPLPDGAVARLGTIQRRADHMAFASTPDEKRIIGLSGGTVYVWDAGTLRLLERYELFKGEYGFTLLSPGGRTAIRPHDEEQSLEFWDVAARKLRWSEPWSNSSLWRPAFSTDGRIFASLISSKDRNRVHVWNLETGKRRGCDDSGVTMDHRNSSLCLSPDGKSLVAVEGACWDVDSGKIRWTTKRLASSQTFTPDGKRIVGEAYGERDGGWVAWDAATGRPADPPDLPNKHARSLPWFTPDGRTAVLEFPDRVEVWDYPACRKRGVLPLRWEVAPELAVVGNTSALVNDGALQRWDLATCKPLLDNPAVRGHIGRATRCRFSPDGQNVVTSGLDRTIRVWERATGRSLHTWPEPVLPDHDPFESHVLLFEYLNDGRIVIIDADLNLTVRDAATGARGRAFSLCTERKIARWPKHVQIFPDGRVLLVEQTSVFGRYVKAVSLWDVHTGRRRSIKMLVGPAAGVMGFSPTGRIAAIWGGELADAATGLKRLLPTGAHTGDGNWVSFSSDDRVVLGRLLFPSDDGPLMAALRMWEVATGLTLDALPAEALDMKYGQILTPDARYLAAVGPSLVRMYDVGTGAEAARLTWDHRHLGAIEDPSPATLSVSPDGRSLVTGFADGTFLMWDLARLRRPNGPLTDQERAAVWTDLGSTSASRAVAAVYRLADDPATLAWLQRMVRPAKRPENADIRQWVADLGSAQFATRDNADRNLRAVADMIEPTLKVAQTESPSAETRRRLAAILADLDPTKPPQGEQLRAVRTIWLLERIGTADAAKFRAELAAGDAAARLTREAKQVP